jgi:hypothetical protein
VVNVVLKGIGGFHPSQIRHLSEFGSKIAKSQVVLGIMSIFAQDSTMVSIQSSVAMGVIPCWLCDPVATEHHGQYQDKDKSQAF